MTSQQWTGVAVTDTWTPPAEVSRVRVRVAGGASEGVLPGLGAVIEDTLTVTGGSTLFTVECGNIPGGAGTSHSGYDPNGTPITIAGDDGGAGSRLDVAGIGDYIGGGGGGHGRGKGGAYPGGFLFGEHGRTPQDSDGLGESASSPRAAPATPGGAGQDFPPGSGGDGGDMYAPGGAVDTPSGGGGGWGGGRGGTVWYETDINNQPSTGIHPAGGGGSKGGQLVDYNQGGPFIVVFHGSQPGKPVAQQPDGEVFRADEDINFVWAHNPGGPDREDGQWAWEIQWQEQGSGSWVSQTGSGALERWVMPANTLTPGVYVWRVRTECDGYVSVWSDAVPFTAVTKSLPPTIVSPNNWDVMGWNQVDLVWASSHQFWQVQELDQNGAVVYDSGERAGTNTSHHIDSPVTNQNVTLRVRVRGDVADWSDWVQVTVTLDDPAPPAPIISVGVSEIDASLTVVVENPAPGPGEVPAVHNNIWVYENHQPVEIRGRVQLDGTWTYWLPRSGVPYSIRVDAVAAGSPATGSSEVTY